VLVVVCSAQEYIAAFFFCVKYYLLLGSFYFSFFFPIIYGYYLDGDINSLYYHMGIIGTGITHVM